MEFIFCRMRCDIIRAKITLQLIKAPHMRIIRKINFNGAISLTGFGICCGSMYKCIKNRLDVYSLNYIHTYCYHFYTLIFQTNVQRREIESERKPRSGN